ncbi:MAG: RimK family protein [Planctomycetaceae bacterium]|nr:RimK family protein [Planctomycetaceae bacterium]
MSALIVAERAEHWPFELPNVEVVDAWRYLTQPEFATRRNVRVVNLCKSYKYQSIGYYVSLLAEARGHRPSPSIITLQDIKSPAMVRLVSDELDDLIQRSLHNLQSDQFILSVYFGRNIAQKYERLSRHLFNLFQAPLLRFRFARDDGDWSIRSVKAVSTGDVPDSHWSFILDAATKHFTGHTVSRPRRQQTRYDLAILHDPTEGENAPSDEDSLKKFVKAGEKLGLGVELIGPDDYARLSEFDALFIRQTTAVNHVTYRFSRRAAGEGLVVMDDPESIARCSNKVYLAELLQRHKVPTPKTVVVHRGNVDDLAGELGFPIVLKKPDSAFSQGVVKAESPEALRDRLNEFFDESELVVAQEFLPTDFDWRIGILDRRPIYACKYFMAPKHWQIIRHGAPSRGKYGKFETLPVESAPRKAVSMALKAANLIGDGLYGVDVKESAGKFYVIEVNDNPNLDSGVEDQVLRDDLYRRVMEVFLRRIEERKMRVAT